MTLLQLRLILLAIAALVVAGALAIALRSDDEYEVVAELKNAVGLRENSPVSIGGVQIGVVKRLDLGDDGVVRVRMAVEDEAAPIGRDASANVRSSNLFGAKYVDLDAGDPRRPAPSGTTIPLARTGTPVEVDDVLATLDPSTRARLRLLIAQSGVALAGRGADFAKLLERLPPGLDRVRRLVGDIARDNDTLAALLTRSDRVLAALAPQRRSLGALVGSAQGAASTMAARTRNLERTIRAAPPTLVQLRSTLGRIDRAADRLTPAARQLTRTAPSLTAFLRELPRFQRTAAPTLSTVRGVSPELTRLARGATPLIGRLRPTSAKLDTFARTLVPLSETLDKGLENALGAVEGWARSIQLRDGPGHIFRGQASLTPQLWTSLIERYVKGGDE